MFDTMAYAKYEDLPKFSYNIIEHLMKCKTDSAEMIWKLLKYTDRDAWQKGNLTDEEKADLIYNGEPIEPKFHIFMDSGMDDAITEESTFIRIYPYYVTPITRTTGVVDIAFEIISHYKINTLSNYQTRTDTILQSLIDNLNGASIGGLGLMYFDNNASRTDKVQSYGISPYRGKVLIMSVNVG